MKKGIAFLTLLSLFFISPLSIAEDALEDGNHIPCGLGYDRSSGVLRMIKTDTEGEIYVNTTWDSGTTAIIDAVTLDDNPTSTTSTTLTLTNIRKLSFLVSYDETEVGNAVSGTLTIEVGNGAGGWISYDLIIDDNGVDSPQSSIIYSVDNEDVFYIPFDFFAGSMRVIFTGTNTDADDTIVVSVWACYQN